MCCDGHLFPSWDSSGGKLLRESFNDLVSPNLFFLTTIISLTTHVVYTYQLEIITYNEN